PYLAIRASSYVVFLHPLSTTYTYTLSLHDALPICVACIYLEGIPREVGAMITAEVETPTIGIGAGPDCDGQVLVFHDIMNLTFGDRKSTRLNSSHQIISYAVFCLKKKN